MSGGKNKQPLGYTIVEVMIVLAVSGVMFLIAASFINGKQQSASFKTGVSQMASQVQDVIEQVVDGRYSDVLLQCHNIGAIPNVTPGTYTQGTSPECVFRGKAVHFYGSSSQINQYDIVSLADLRDSSATEGSTARPSVIGIGSSSVKLTAQNAVPQNLSIAGFKADGASHYPAPTLVFLQSLGSSSVSRNGAQSLEMATTDSITSADAGYQRENLIGGSGAGLITFRSSASICLTDGKRFATVNIGSATGSTSDGSQLNVTQQLGLTSCP